MQQRRRHTAKRWNCPSSPIWRLMSWITSRLHPGCMCWICPNLAVIVKWRTRFCRKRVSRWVTCCRVLSYVRKLTVLSKVINFLSNWWMLQDISKNLSNCQSKQRKISSIFWSPQMSVRQWLIYLSISSWLKEWRAKSTMPHFGSSLGWTITIESSPKISIDIS